MGQNNGELQEDNYFSEMEFRTPDYPDKPVSIDVDFLKLLNVARRIYGKPIHINSGHRSPEHNKAVGGSSNSKHLLQPVVAADIRISNGGHQAKRLQRAFFLAEEETGINFSLGSKRKSGEQNGFLHIDTFKGREASWTY